MHEGIATDSATVEVAAPATVETVTVGIAPVPPLLPTVPPVIALTVTVPNPALTETLDVALPLIRLRLTVPISPLAPVLPPEPPCGAVTLTVTKLPVALTLGSTRRRASKCNWKKFILYR